MYQKLSEQEVQRRDKLDRLKSLGIDPYPAEEFKINCSSEDILKNFSDNKSNYESVVIAGRLMRRNIMGKASFAKLQDTSGRIQIYFNRDEICTGEDKTLYNDVYKKLLDIFMAG